MTHLTKKERSRDGLRYSRMDIVKFFKGCLSQILLGPLLNTLTQMSILA